MSVNKKTLWTERASEKLSGFDTTGRHEGTYVGTTILSQLQLLKKTIAMQLRIDWFWSRV